MKNQLNKNAVTEMKIRLNSVNSTVYRIKGLLNEGESDLTELNNECALLNYEAHKASEYFAKEQNRTNGY